MHSDLVERGWTEEHWNRICTAVTEEAQKARVAAQVLTVTGPLDPTTVAIPTYALAQQPNPQLVPANTSPARLEVDSDPTLYLTKISVNVYLRGREAADPDLNAALTMFRRAANYIARLEDTLVFNGRPGPGAPPNYLPANFPGVYQIGGDGQPEGLLPAHLPAGARFTISVSGSPGATPGDRIVTAIVRSVNALDAAGQLPPYACVLSSDLFEQVCTPNAALVLPRDRILPFLEGPLLRSSAIQSPYGVVVALSASPVELVVASDIHVRFLQTSEQPRLVFQVSEKVALRIKEPAAIAVLDP